MDSICGGFSGAGGSMMTSSSGGGGGASGVGYFLGHRLSTMCVSCSFAKEISYWDREEREDHQEPSECSCGFEL